MINTLLQRLTQLIRPERARQLAKEQGWYRRQGKISPFEFLYSGLGQGSALELTLSAQASSLSEPVSRQAIDQRYNPAAVKFFKHAFQESLAQTLNWKTDSAMTRLLGQRFAALRLFDSTHCPCSDALAQLFPACVSCNFQKWNSVCDQKETALCDQKWTGHQKTGQWSRTRGWVLGLGACWR